MRQTTIKLMLLLVLGLWFMPAQADDEKDYLKLAAEMREKVWNDDDPMFKNYDCPQQYCDPNVCSAVILASRTDADVMRKSSIRMVLWFPENDKQLKRHELNRMLIKLNDAAALKKFSEFDYTTIKKERYNDKHQQVLGVRIIKPDGRIVDVNTDDYMTTREGKKENEVSHKLAVPGLEVGDILDLFTFSEMIVHDRNVPPFSFWFLDEYPVLNYKVRCVIDKKCTVQYRTLNGAPDFTISKDEDNNTVFEAQMSHLDQVAPRLWYNAIAQSPVTLLYVYDKSVTQKQLKSVRNRDVQANPSFSNIMLDDAELLKTDLKVIKKDFNWGRHKGLMKGELARAKKMADKDEAAKLLYTGLMYSYWGFARRDYSPFHLMLMLGKMLEMCNVPYQYMIATDRDNEPLTELISSHNTQWLIKAGKGTILAPPDYPSMTAGQIPASLQGRTAAVLGKQDSRPQGYDDVYTTTVSGKQNGAKSAFQLIELPKSTATDNCEAEVIHASIDGTLMNVERTTTCTGTAKANPASQLVVSKQYYDACDQYLERKKPYIQNVSKSYRKANLDVFEKDARELADKIKAEVSANHGQDPVQVNGYEVLAVGVDPQHPEFAYKTDYSMNGWVKKAGSNLVVSVGKLIGSHMKVEGNDRQRNADINCNSPLLLTWDITMDVPNGYQVSEESLAKLQQHVSNGAGEFSSTAQVEGGQLRLKVVKRYSRADYPASQWQEFLQVIDTADDFTNRQVVFKK